MRSPSAMSNRSAAYQSSGQQEPEIHTIKLHKSNNGMGLSIVAAKVCIPIYLHQPQIILRKIKESKDII